MIWNKSCRRPIRYKYFNACRAERGGIPWAIALTPTTNRIRKTKVALSVSSKQTLGRDPIVKIVTISVYSFTELGSKNVVAI